MRGILVFSALAIALGWAAPSSAQMCGAGQAASTAASGGMSCSMMRPTASQAPGTGQSAQPQQRPGMCACCQHMAMMRGGSGQMDGMMHSPMGQPQAPSPQQEAPGTPETPRPQ